MNPSVLFDRSAGVLLHPTSLPGPYGIGDLGPATDRWLDWLAGTGCRLWQVLPLGPTSFGDSPYQCFSSAAGNPLLISPELLVQDGLLSQPEIALETMPADGIDYGTVIAWKGQLLDRAFARMTAAHQQEFGAFREAQADWLDDFALFMALKERFGGRAWSEWDADARSRSKDVVRSAHRWLEPTVTRYAFQQWLFFGQWSRVQAVAEERGIQIFGDMPLYVASDSADVWARPDMFELDSDGRPTVVAGVPPDYFSPTGQLWGNPIYRWAAHRKDGYQWWIDRVSRTLQLVDIVRIDHFRGFVDYWEIPAGSPTAEMGRWLDGPGEALFTAIADALGSLPIVAEDLGDLSPGVGKLRDKLGLAGMKILQFAWDGDDENPFLPHHIEENSIAYTGTHDNDTTVGWFESAPSVERQRVLDYLGTTGETISWDLIATAWASKAVVAIAPVQDLLAKPTSARMNMPGARSGNWQWRLAAGELGHGVADRLYSLNLRTNRGRTRA